MSRNRKGLCWKSVIRNDLSKTTKFGFHVKPFLDRPVIT